MKPNSYLKALSIFLLLVFVVIGVIYFASPASLVSKYATSYMDFPDPKPMPKDETAAVVDVAGVINAFDSSADGSVIAIATSKVLILYDLHTLKEINSLPLDEQVFQVQFSPDASKLAVSGYVAEYWDRGSQHVTVWDIASWKSGTNIKAIPSYTTYPVRWHGLQIIIRSPSPCGNTV